MIESLRPRFERMLGAGAQSRSSADQAWTDTPFSPGHEPERQRKPGLQKRRLLNTGSASRGALLVSHTRHIVP
jgi:hypothetical protein